MNVIIANKYRDALSTLDIDVIKKMDGESYIRDEDNYFCAWSAEYDEHTRVCHMIMDIFDREGDLWARSEEEHVERAHSDEEIANVLKKAGFKLLARYDELSFNPADETSQRVFYVAERN